MPLRVLIAHNSTGPANITIDGLGTRQIIRSDGSATSTNDLRAGGIAVLTDTGSAFQLENPLQGVASTSNTYLVNIPYCADTSSTANQIIAPYNPVLTAVTEGMFIAVKVKNLITGATTIAVNAIAPLPICRDDGTPLQAGDILALETILIEHHGTYYQMTGLVRSQVLLPPAPVLRGIIATQSGYGAQYFPTSVGGGTVLACYNVMKNNLKTSTFDGLTLTIGAGEDGVWALEGGIHLQQIGVDCNYASVFISVNGAGNVVAIQGTSSIVAGSGTELSCSCSAKLNVGDQVQCRVYQQAGVANYSQPDETSCLSGFLISK
jgi:hypothetical protein